VGLAEFRYCTHANLAVAYGHITVLDRVFDAVFGSFLDPAESRGKGGPASDPCPVWTDGRLNEQWRKASEGEALRHKDFSDLSPAELDRLAGRWRNGCS